MLDATAAAQIRETRDTLNDHLRAEPDDDKALFLAGVVAELDPDRDPGLRAHAERDRRRRQADPAAWAARARALGLDVVLCNLALGMERARIGAAAIPVIARHGAEVSANGLVLASLRGLVDGKPGDAAGRARRAIDAAIAAHVPALAAGAIDASFVPAALAASPRARVRYHPGGHLAEATVDNGAWQGTLALAATPGAGTFRLEGTSGGYGHVTHERYAGGTVHTTLNTPWHDGCEAEAAYAWTRWVAECLQSLADAAV